MNRGREAILVDMSNVWRRVWLFCVPLINVLLFVYYFHNNETTTHERTHSRRTFSATIHQHFSIPLGPRELAASTLVVSTFFFRVSFVAAFVAGYNSGLGVS